MNVGFVSIAVLAILTGGPVAHSAEVDGSEFKEVSLKCPTDISQQMEYDLVDVAKRTIGRHRFFYDRGALIIYTLETWPIGGASPDELFSIDIRTEINPEKKDYWMVLGLPLEQKLKDICTGPADLRAAYLAALEANRKALGLD